MECNFGLHSKEGVCLGHHKLVDRWGENGGTCVQGLIVYSETFVPLHPAPLEITSLGALPLLLDQKSFC